jgi:hypothetical protein
MYSKAELKFLIDSTIEEIQAHLYNNYASFIVPQELTDEDLRMIQLPKGYTWWYRDGLIITKMLGSKGVKRAFIIKSAS